ncbi:amidohydrolase [Caldithrix abyssi]
MSDLRVTLVQTNLHWQNPSKNRSALEGKLEEASAQSDLVVLPEMFTTGFTMEAARVAEEMDGPTIGWMRKWAVEMNIHIIGSLIIKEDNRYYNRLIWMTNRGEYYHYDKRHLFRMAGENEVYSAGNKLLTLKVNGWKVRPFICYDLRFPVWSRNVDLAYDVAIYIANWPERRRNVWRILLQARAAENQAFVIGVNRTGADGLGIKYSGDSLAVDPVGNILEDLKDKEKMATCQLSRAQLDQFRQKFPSWKDADRFEIVDVEENIISLKE